MSTINTLTNSVAALIDKVLWFKKHTPPDDAGTEAKNSFELQYSQAREELYNALTYYGPVTHMRHIWFRNLPPRTGRVNSIEIAGRGVDLPWPPGLPQEVSTEQPKPIVEEKVINLDRPETPT